ncbi:uncharacterized protein TRIVIDRAFT_58866 [Trichoderma virens Gv29-8]|uniref:Uncharacterized protein n=1 Tax=Hypocrea virens (strain Gv29-8 / FGSC 10586) TaxID=413071 RepID=G9MYJ9_HYPVG|nr:uncharacterized protein TRIVIDRAFT_58866 [Trichoderma virens Gv29-8]EHK20619.1 hypothetical protein TRIVIDRAFT_58866 [Trichoderma virens Gv29-8]UKZ53079.1 hypothetical protein TrVGV298_006867 [Trichoderma virens]
MANHLGALTDLLPSDEVKLRAVLKTPYDRVYRLSPDGSTFLEPVLLIGTPGQAPEAVMKDDAHKRLLLNPNDKTLKDAHKHYSDNSSKFKKIREIFGEGSKYHPNQLIAKQYLPPDGLCQKEVMYRLACKISDLQHLYRRGELAMDPFDFIRWRIIKKAGSLLEKPGDTPKNFIRTVVYKLCDPDSQATGAKVYHDSVMRQAVLLSAAQRNHLGNYGSKGKHRKNSATQQRPLPYREAASRAVARPVQRRARPAAGPPIYAGVNAFRAGQQQRQRTQQRATGN